MIIFNGTFKGLKVLDTTETWKGWNKEIKRVTVIKSNIKQQRQMQADNNTMWDGLKETNMGMTSSILKNLYKFPHTQPQGNFYIKIELTGGIQVTITVDPQNSFL